MRTIRCPRCKKMYEYDGMPPKFCYVCEIAEKEMHTTVRNYVKVHRGADIMEVSEQTGVSRAKILEYVREGTLEIINAKFKV